MKKTDAPTYLQIGHGMNAPRRLAELRRLAGDGKTWQAARAWNLANWSDAYSALAQGYNDSDNGPKKAIWYCHTGEQFRDERNADEISGAGVDHHGWYADADCSRTIYGIVGRLTHGRFIAGYANTDTSERVYFGEVYDNEKDAARAADSEAQRVAEDEKEYDERWNAARKLSEEIANDERELREKLALRNNPKFDWVRDEATSLIDSIRENRDTLKNDYSDIQL